MAATSQNYTGSGLYANGASTINGALGVGAVTSTDLVQSTNLASGTAGTEFVVDTSGNITASGTIDCGAVTSTDLVQSTNLASGTEGTEFTVDTSGDCVANSFTGDGSGLTGITVSNIYSTAALTIPDDGISGIATTIPIGEAAILMIKCKNADDACCCAVLGGADGAQYMARTAGTTSSTQLVVYDGAIFYEVRYAESWGGGVSSSACNMTEIRQVIE